MTDTVNQEHIRRGALIKTRGPDGSAVPGYITEVLKRNRVQVVLGRGRGRKAEVIPVSSIIEAQWKP